MKKKTTKYLQEILDQVQLEGYHPGTFQYEYIVQKRKVERCQELHGVGNCRSCFYFDSCELSKNFLRIQAELKRRHDLELAAKEKKQKAFVEAQLHTGGIHPHPTVGIGSPPIPDSMGNTGSIISDPFELPGAPFSRGESSGSHGGSLHSIGSSGQPPSHRGPTTDSGTLPEDSE